MALPNTAGTVGEGFGGRAVRVLGKLFGRRVVRGGDELIIPETREGRALRVLLAGSGGSLPVGLDTIRDRAEQLQELRELIDAVIGQARPELDAVRIALADRNIHEPWISQLSADEWVTAERINNLWCAIKHSEGYRWVNDPTAVLITALKNHQVIEEDDPHEFWACAVCKVMDSQMCTCDNS